MTPELAQVIEAGRALSDDEREIAALVLLHGDDPVDQEEIDAEWSETIERRLGDILSGKIVPVSGRETLAMARAKSAALRNDTRLARTS